MGRIAETEVVHLVDTDEILVRDSIRLERWSRSLGSWMLLGNYDNVASALAKAKDFRRKFPTAKFQVTEGKFTVCASSASLIRFDDRVVSRGVIVRLQETDEWLVKCWDQFGERFEDADYYTDDKLDAIFLLRMLLAQGAKE